MWVITLCDGVIRVIRVITLCDGTPQAGHIANHLIRVISVIRVIGLFVIRVIWVLQSGPRTGI